MEVIRYIGATANFEKLLNEINISMGTDLYGTDGYASMLGATGSFNFSIGLTAGQITTLDTTISSHIGETDWQKPRHRICNDVHEEIAKKPVYAINYKTELETDVSYTPVYTIGAVGATVGLLVKTEYYKNFVDSNNLGEIILEVAEEYVIDQSETGADHTRKSVLSRTKHWKYYMDNGTIDYDHIKNKIKLYDTRSKQQKEGIKRRENVIDQLVDNIGLAGVLITMGGATGGFSDTGEAHAKLSELQETYGNEFSSWLLGGLGSLTSVIATDSSIEWLDTIIPDTGYTQAYVPWMIGMTFKAYIPEKLKGNIK